MLSVDFSAAIANVELIAGAVLGFLAGVWAIKKALSFVMSRPSGFEGLGADDPKDWGDRGY